MVNKFAEHNKDFARGCTRFRQVKDWVVQEKYFICQLCTSAFKQYIYVFCSSDCDSADEDDEETVDATEIQENMMDITTSMFANFDVWLVLTHCGTGVSNEMNDPGGTQEPSPTTEGYSVYYCCN